MISEAASTIALILMGGTFAILLYGVYLFARIMNAVRDHDGPNAEGKK